MLPSGDYFLNYMPQVFAVLPGPGGSAGKNSLPMQETGVPSWGGEDPLEKEMETHPSILAWYIPWTEEPGGLQSMRLQKGQT